MKNLTKIVALLAALVMVLSVVACTKTVAPTAPETTTTAPATTTEPEAAKPLLAAEAYAGREVDFEAYTADSQALYDTMLGDFYSLYMAAKEETNLSTKYALMAAAEAKLLEDAVFLPIYSQGGNYAIGRTVPYSATTVLWGNDSYRYHQIIVTNELLKTTDRDALKAMWKELKGTGTYEQSAKDYLTSNGYTLKDSYTLGYTSDPVTWDTLSTSRAADSEAIVNTFDGLFEYDTENVQQPALALGYEVSDDGLVYTFKLREGVEWVDSQGRKVADVVADDFVAGMQHMMDAQGGLEYLVVESCQLAGAEEYIGGTTTDFAEVGVKALDDYTLQYTLNAPCSYFDTMWGYSIFAPMSRTYYESQGGKFGAEYDPSAESYTYGKDSDHIAYCGPYLVTNATAENTIVFSANPSYWNKDNINAKTITWLYNDGSDALKAYNDMTAGVLDACSLNTSAMEVAVKDGIFDDYNYVTANDATSYCAFLNVNRFAYSNVADTTTVASPVTVEEADRTHAAMQNVHFRRAILLAWDRGTYNAQSVGETLKYNSLRNSYTPGTFVTLAEDVTISINGVETTFPAGTFYGQVMQAQMDADNCPIMVWDSNAEGGIGSGDGFDGWYNVENAQAEMAIAVEELAAEGIVIDAENPIYLDLPTLTISEAWTNKSATVQQCIASAFGGAVVVNGVACNSAQEWYYSGYYTDNGFEANYDIYDLSGWGPDYGDPSTYLDTFLPQFSGYMAKCIGIF